MKLAVFAIVSDMGMEKGLDARAWVKASESLWWAGRKPNMAQGSIAEFLKMEEAVAEAQKYLL